MKNLYILNPAIAAISSGDSCYLIRPDQKPMLVPSHAIPGFSWLLRATFPVSDEQLSKEVGEAARRFFVDEQVVLAANHADLLRKMKATERTGKPCRHLVLGLTGAVASMQVAPVALGLRAFFADELDLILTASAQSFVNADAFSRAGIRAWTDAFSPRGQINVPHVHLADAAELVVVMPASAHTLHKVATGACSDLLSLTIAATRAPVVFVPAMNRAMWRNPAISRNVQRLRDDGYYIVEPGLGFDVAHGADTATQLGCVMGLAQFTLFQLLEQILQMHRRRQETGVKEPAQSFASATR